MDGPLDTMRMMLWLSKQQRKLTRICLHGFRNTLNKLLASVISISGCVHASYVDV